MESSSLSVDVKAEVAGALWSLSEATDIKVAIAGASAIQPLVLLLGMGHAFSSKRAAAALGSLGLDNEENQVQSSLPDARLELAFSTAV